MELEGTRIQARGQLGGRGEHAGEVAGRTGRGSTDWGLNSQRAGGRCVAGGCLSSPSLGGPVCEMGTTQLSLRAAVGERGNVAGQAAERVPGWFPSRTSTVFPNFAS